MQPNVQYREVFVRPTMFQVGWIYYYMNCPYRLNGLGISRHAHFYTTYIFKKLDAKIGLQETIEVYDHNDLQTCFTRKKLIPIKN